MPELNQAVDEDPLDETTMQLEVLKQYGCGRSKGE